MIYLRVYRQINSERTLLGYFSGLAMRSSKQAVVKMTVGILPSSEGAMMWSCKYYIIM